MFQRLETIRRSTGAGIKSAISDFTPHKNKRPKRGNKQHQLGLHLEEDANGAAHLTGRQSAIDIPSPHVVLVRIQSGSAPLLDDRSHPQAVPPSDQTGTTHELQDVSCKTNDNGFIDPLPSANSLDVDECGQERPAGYHKSKESGGEGSKEDSNGDEVRPKRSGTFPEGNDSSDHLCQSPDGVFTADGEEVDFEKAPCRTSVKLRRRKFFATQCLRPDSVIFVESDSEDSDTTSDQHYASLAEEEFTSPDCSPSPSPPPSPALVDIKAVIFHIGGEGKEGIPEVLDVQSCMSNRNEQLPLAAVGDGTDRSGGGVGESDGVDGDDDGDHVPGKTALDSLVTEHQLGSLRTANEQKHTRACSNKEDRPSDLPLIGLKSISSASSLGEITPSSTSLQSVTPSDEESGLPPKKPPRRKRKRNGRISDTSPTEVDISEVNKKDCKENLLISSLPLLADPVIHECSVKSPNMKRAHSDGKPNPKLRLRHAKTAQARRTPPHPPVKSRTPPVVSKVAHHQYEPSPLVQVTTTEDDDDEKESSLEKTLVSPEHSNHIPDLKTLKRESHSLEKLSTEVEQHPSRLEVDYLPHPFADSSFRTSSTLVHYSGSSDSSKRRLTVNSPLDAAYHFDWARQNIQRSESRGASTWAGESRMLGRITQGNPNLVSIAILVCLFVRCF